SIKRPVVNDRIILDGLVPHEEPGGTSTLSTEPVDAHTSTDSGFAPATDIIGKAQSRHPTNPLRISKAIGIVGIVGGDHTIIRVTRSRDEGPYLNCRNKLTCQRVHSNAIALVVKSGLEEERRLGWIVPFPGENCPVSILGHVWAVPHPAHSVVQGQMGRSFPTVLCVPLEQPLALV